ncbi:hypothetical protein ACFE04_007681 [Oxalis oulophora]
MENRFNSLSNSLSGQMEEIHALIALIAKVVGKQSESSPSIVDAHYQIILREYIKRCTRTSRPTRLIDDMDISRNAKVNLNDEFMNQGWGNFDALQTSLPFSKQASNIAYKSMNSMICAVRDLVINASNLTILAMIAHSKNFEKLLDEDGSWEEQEQGETVVAGEKIDETSRRCSLSHKSSKRGDDLSSEKYTLWRQEQKTRALKLEKQLQARREQEELLEEQLNRFRSHYNRPIGPTQLKDVAQLLMPKWAPPHELAALYWLGDWRPSAILEFLRVMIHSSSSKFDSNCEEHLLSEIIHDIRIEEAIIDEEMAEIQTTSVLYLPFSPVNKQSNDSSLGRIQDEFKKFERVINKAQLLRSKAMESIVTKVLNQVEAAEFFVTFAGVQDAIHQYAENLKSNNGQPSVPSPSRH